MQAKGKMKNICAECSQVFLEFCDIKRALLLQQHRKVLDKGKPDDIMASIKGTKVREGEGRSTCVFVCLVYTAVQSCCCAYYMILIPHTKTELPFAANRNDYQQCL